MAGPIGSPVASLLAGAEQAALEAAGRRVEGIEAELAGKEKECQMLRETVMKIREDFEFNLEVLSERDEVLARKEEAIERLDSDLKSLRMECETSIVESDQARERAVSAAECAAEKQSSTLRKTISKLEEEVTAAKQEKRNMILQIQELNDWKVNEAATAQGWKDKWEAAQREVETVSKECHDTVIEKEGLLREINALKKDNHLVYIQHESSIFDLQQKLDTTTAGEERIARKLQNAVSEAKAKEDMYEKKLQQVAADAAQERTEIQSRFKEKESELQSKYEEVKSFYDEVLRQRDEDANEKMGEYEKQITACERALVMYKETYLPEAEEKAKMLEKELREVRTDLAKREAASFSASKLNEVGNQTKDLKISELEELISQAKLERRELLREHEVKSAETLEHLRVVDSAFETQKQKYETMAENLRDDASKLSLEKDEAEAEAKRFRTLWEEGRHTLECEKKNHEEEVTAMKIEIEALRGLLEDTKAEQAKEFEAMRSSLEEEREKTERTLRTTETEMMNVVAEHRLEVQALKDRGIGHAASPSKSMTHPIGTPLRSTPGGDNLFSSPVRSVAEAALSSMSGIPERAKARIANLETQLVASQREGETLRHELTSVQKHIMGAQSHHPEKAGDSKPSPLSAKNAVAHLAEFLDHIELEGAPVKTKSLTTKIEGGGGTHDVTTQLNMTQGLLDLMEKCMSTNAPSDIVHNIRYLLKDAGIKLRNAISEIKKHNTFGKDAQLLGRYEEIKRKYKFLKASYDRMEIHKSIAAEYEHPLDQEEGGPKKVVRRKSSVVKDSAPTAARPLYASPARTARTGSTFASPAEAASVRRKRSQSVWI